MVAIDTAEIDAPLNGDAFTLNIANIGRSWIFSNIVLPSAAMSSFQIVNLVEHYKECDY